MTTDTGKWQPWPSWVSVILGLVTLAILIVQISQPISANDLWWHMALGRHILESGSLIIDHAIFTWTPASSYHVYNSWLADILLYLTYDYTGTFGLIALRFGIYFLLFYLAWRYALTRGIAGNPITWVVVLVALALIWPAFLIKPELFTVGFFTLVVWLYFHMRYRGDHAWKLPYLFPLILIIWINVHGAFFVSSLFFAAAGIGEIMNGQFSPSQAMPSRLRKHFFIALFLCIPAIMASPFGYELPLSIISDVLTSEGMNKYIVSYKPTFEFNGAPLYMLDYMLLAMLLFVLLLWQKLKNRKTDWVVILTFLGYCAIFTQVARLAFFLGPVFMFTSLDLLAEKKNSWVWSPSKTIKTIVIALCITITAIVGWRTANDNSCKLFGSEDSIKRLFGVSSVFPIAETEYIKNNLAGRKVGNMYRDGGYLLYHLWPGKQVMIDPRYFPFKGWINSYIDFTQGKDIEKFINHNHADFWLINYHDPSLFHWFYRSKDWKLDLLGATGAIFTPEDGLDTEPKVSPAIATIMGFGDLPTAFIAAIQMNDLKFAKLLFAVAKTKQGIFCNKNIVITREMGDAIAGLQAYNNGNYAEAARILGKETKYIKTQNKAARGLMLLAEQYWNRGDISSARDMYLKAFKINSLKTITDLYNFTLIDWLYRHSDAGKSREINGDLHWQKLANFILAQEDKIQQSQRYIVATARAMKDGRYDGTAKFVLHDGSFAPAIHKGK